jgi:two-component system sensor histidine kinase KdpD
VELCVREGLPLVRVDYGLMEQVLYNLVYNAVLYTPKGSMIRIGADFPVDDPDGRLMIVVEDDGPGFPVEEIDRVFEKFYRLNHTGIRGSGLGLSIVKGFVEAHDGTVTLTNRSEEGAAGGARFEISMTTDKFYLN